MRESVPRIEMNVPDFRGFHKFLRKKFVRNNFLLIFALAKGKGSVA